MMNVQNKSLTQTFPIFFQTLFGDNIQEHLEREDLPGSPGSLQRESEKFTQDIE